MMKLGISHPVGVPRNGLLLREASNRRRKFKRGFTSEPLEDHAKAAVIRAVLPTVRR
jgi:hypothetical protein